jgi:MoaA/NifB/PqqE/SkfB family radical SAM enzyme
MRFRGRVRLTNKPLCPGHLFQAPSTFVLGVNNFCNLHCRICDVGTGNFETNFGANLAGASNRLMSLDLCRRTLEKIAQWSPSAVVAFVYTEPLAWPPIIDAIAYASKLGLRAQVTTNGLLLPRHVVAV